MKHVKLVTIHAVIPYVWFHGFDYRCRSLLRRHKRVNNYSRCALPFAIETSVFWLARARQVLQVDGSQVLPGTVRHVLH